MTDTDRLVAIVEHLVRELGGTATVPEAVIADRRPTRLVIAYEELAGRYRLTILDEAEPGPAGAPLRLV